MILLISKLHNSFLFAYLLSIGGNIGIGYAIVKQLLIHKATVVIASRSQARIDTAVESLINETNVASEKVVGLLLDLSSLTYVQTFVEHFKR